MEYADFLNKHEGEGILVAGIGPSVHHWQPPACVSIGVNDIDRYFPPTYLLACDALSMFAFDRREWIKCTRAEAIFSPRYEHGARTVRVEWGEDRGTRIGAKLPTFKTSVYPAICLAAYMGAAKIGVIGCDLVFKEAHVLGAHEEAIVSAMNDLGQALLETRGVEVRNLSTVSKLTLPPGDIEWLMS